ncbi:MAG TPA: tetraacyldisaccharide 4'-kinase [Pseudolabrys sp.]|nr:tetraacyldisaccharide 4'-kinase [Pseudolabrys sp.]
MREPAFWWRGAGPQAQLLAPLGLIYGTITARRMATEGAHAGLPVLCVGNFTLGGAGKTPAVIMLAKMLAENGGRPFCLSRGYGGTETGPRLVDGRSDSAAQVGDEALLLARAAPTVVARDRVDGAEFARTQGASVIILDDGLQNPSLAKDFTLAVIDARRGIGNARVFPAGPLRAPLDAQLARTDAMLVVGEGNAADGVAAQLRAQSRPVFHARLAPDKAAVSALSGQNVLAFAGIGDPDKFFATAHVAGIVVSERRTFPDHHRYTPQDASELILRAQHSALTLLTTEKDRARMDGDPRLAKLAASVQTLPVTMIVEEAGELRALIEAKLPR